jgi:hypothetical protein
MSRSGPSRRQTLEKCGLRRRSLAFALAFSLLSSSAHAEVGQDDVSPGIKGTVGLTLLGAETVLAVEAALGVRTPWIFAVGGGGGAIAGSIGGYYVDKAGNSEVSMSLLVAGLLLAIPTTIAVLNASAYRPPQNPVADNGNSTSYLMGSKYPAHHGMLQPPLVGLGGDGQVHLQIPSVSIRPVFSKTTRQIHSLPNATSVEVSVFGLIF